VYGSTVVWVYGSGARVGRSISWVRGNRGRVYGCNGSISADVRAYRSGVRVGYTGVGVHQLGAQAYRSGVRAYRSGVRVCGSGVTGPSARVCRHTGRMYGSVVRV
jgi:hypothetical protein